jgi:hypothetical protein
MLEQAGLPTNGPAQWAFLIVTNWELELFEVLYLKLILTMIPA